MPFYVDFYDANLGCNELIIQKLIERYTANSSGSNLRFKPNNRAIAGTRSASIFKFHGTRKVGNREFMDFERQLVYGDVLPGRAAATGLGSNKMARLILSAIRRLTDPTFAPTSTRTPPFR